MHWRNTISRYGFVAVTLHWVIVAGIIAQYFVAEAAEEAEGAVAGAVDAANIHMSIGITILTLAVVRALWRMAELTPARPPAMKSYEITFARVAHIAFYVLLFAIPLSGWALATADGQPLRYFGLFELPQLRIGAQLPALSEDQLEEVHELLFNVLLGLALLHVAAALKHQFIDHDNVLRSMLPAWGKRERT